MGPTLYALMILLGTFYAFPQPCEELYSTRIVFQRSPNSLMLTEVAVGYLLQHPHKAFLSTGVETSFVPPVFLEWLCEQVWRRC